MSLHKLRIINRNRLVYGLLTIGVILLGLSSRRFFDEIDFIRQYVGDVLWALMVFFGFAFVWNKWPTRRIALAAIVFSFGIEISQLYHAYWIDYIRATRLGALVLGFTFVWSDFACYSLGVLTGMGIDGLLLHFKKSEQ